MERITLKDLDHVVDAINVAEKTPPKPFSARDANGKITANVGNYHISSAYGGWCLEQMMNERGGVRDVFQVGHVPKRELYGLLRAYFSGLRQAMVWLSRSWNARS